ncbi:hypothetical protein SAMN05444401_1758 [Clostridium amylolyticum]|uniref:Uncharacterized protein n=1 Tax=Clostridium amylolyticum TaxID=1121298 RepID=A0A1M6EZZ7_9CLOT|nr:hypothetical protein [Clostridium amylolyticum]SHI91048.1 hypothetical protein SAMN05444401_1758 [Clostridium amylolyticum]
MIVSRVKRLKEETVSLVELKDLEDAVITTMGEDVWNAIQYFAEEKALELEEEIKYLKEGSKCDDGHLYALRGGIRDEIDVIEKLITKVNEAQRLDRRSLTKELQGIVKRLENNEGYF